MSDRPVAVVSRRGAARWDAGHPWIFRSDVVEMPDAPAGSVVVTDQRGKPLGVALWSPASEISLRLVDRDPGAPLDLGWWERRLSAAIARRAALEGVTNAWRVVHGEGDALPSLIVDRYDRYLVVQLMSAGIEAYRAEIVAALEGLLAPAGILARNDAATRSREGLARETVILAGEVPREIEVDEYGVRYLAAPWTGQKTGAFIDQRDNRRLVGSVARGVALDCFSYHGSFALHLARGASRVTALDASGEALERARERDGSRYDTIVLDPPAFAKNRASVAGALRGYKDINLRAIRLLAPGGLLYTASCSYHVTKPMFLDMLRDAAADSGRRVILREITGQPVDHPEVLTIPETGYLKGALLEVER